MPTAMAVSPLVVSPRVEFTAQQRACLEQIVRRGSNSPVVGTACEDSFSSGDREVSSAM